MRPDRVVVGFESEKAKKIIASLYKPLFLIETPILFTDLKTAELIKYSANAFLALKISYINQMADLCEKIGADVHDVAKGIGLDKRIGNKFLNPGPGYGGSCFKPETDDMRDSPSLDIIPILQKNGITISAYDPVAMNEAKKLLKNTEFSNDLETCLQNSDALVILTEWNQFRGLLPDYLSKYMKGNILIDLRNALDPENFINSNFNLVQIGRGREINQ